MQLKEESKERGHFIVLYASNNLGKSEQAKRLATKFIQESRQILVVKYPIYGLEPTGPKINQVLRKPEELDHEVSDRELQKMYAQNRRDFQETLIATLNAGITVVAEDYTGTGIAWGMTRDVDLSELEDFNKDLIKPDLAILLDGERFRTSIEKKHRNEGEVEAVWQKNREMHLFLAKRYEWRIVKANQDIERVSQDILDILKEELGD